MMPSPKKPKAKPKPRKSGKDQSARFIETAREVDADETGEVLENIFTKLVPPKAKQHG
jgi:hypothetical protein